jgi:ABC-type transporter Mla subunit MlaD
MTQATEIDIRELKTAIDRNTKTIESIGRSTEANTRAVETIDRRLEALTRTTEANAKAIEANTKAIADLTSSVTGLREEIHPSFRTNLDRLSSRICQIDAEPSHKTLMLRIYITGAPRPNRDRQ